MVKSKVCVVTFFMLSVFTPKPKQLRLPFAVNQRSNVHKITYSLYNRYRYFKRDCYFLGCR